MKKKMMKTINVFMDSKAKNMRRIWKLFFYCYVCYRHGDITIKEDRTNERNRVRNYCSVSKSVDFSSFLESILA